MRLLVYGGSFNPPHIGHVNALKCAMRTVRPDVTLVIPAGEPPHKELAPGSPTPEVRLALTRLAFAGIDGLTVSDREISSAGIDYTVETLSAVKEDYPGAELFFLIGTDMLMAFEQWYDFRRILSIAALVVLPRNTGELPSVREQCRHLSERYGGTYVVLEDPPLPADSTSLRRDLPLRGGRALLTDSVYGEIVRQRLYGAKPELCWLREKAYAYLKPKRIPHAQGCESEAVRLALRWGEDPGDAAEAGILHDITKKLSCEEQRKLFREFGISLSDADREAEPIWHAITGAPFARSLFGISDAVFEAIRWHTTGCPGMSRLAMIVFLADYIEPNRSFDGVDAVRSLAYSDLREALLLSMKLSLEHMRGHGVVPHPLTAATLVWLQRQGEL